MRRASKVGYCETCAENTHFAVILTRFLSGPVRWFTSRVGMGPWYCGQCRGQRWKLHRPLASSSGESIDGMSVAPGTVSVGNFIRGESNLVMQSARSSRYSEKFRAGVVQRVLDGKQSLPELARELALPQADILVWVGQQFAKKQDQIDKLNRTIDQLSQGSADRLRIETRYSLDQLPDHEGAAEATDVIDGQVNPG